MSAIINQKVIRIRHKADCRQLSYPSKSIEWQVVENKIKKTPLPTGEQSGGKTIAHQVMVLREGATEASHTSRERHETGIPTYFIRVELELFQK
ncbi:jg15600 [Pararge aegeria aegeria]|uniref:Jg15600 protein n=1 Tax=Pararge aegeria aegeria TaxID=348720 RepID=A0A8S4RSV6_9NEOP|nr:jg15600 [Pararge aegeria aegeria]